MWSGFGSFSGLSPSAQNRQRLLEEQEEQLHRKRVAQILRYISTMQTSGGSSAGGGGAAAGQQCSFVRALEQQQQQQRYGPFFQDVNTGGYNNNNNDDDLASVGGGRVLFTLYDFQRLAALMAASDSVGTTGTAGNTQQQQPLPFSFYTAGNKASGSNNNKRNFLGRRVGSSSSNAAASSSADACCWLRLTRLTAADVPNPPPLSAPVIIAYLQSWLADDRFARLATMEPASATTFQLLERLLPPNLRTQVLPESAPAKVQRWWRRYTHYRKVLQLQRQLEPLYNHLFEWYHQTQDSGMDQSLDLIWGLGQAQLRGTGGTVIDGPLLEVHVEVELARDGALLVRPKEHAGVSLNRHVLAGIASVGTNTSTTTGVAAEDETIEAATATTGGGTTKSSSAESSTARQLRQLVEGMNASDLSPGQPSTYISLLKRMAVELSSGGTFQSSSHTKQKQKQSKQRLESLLRQGQLVVTDAWCVYSSPRPSAVWARDAYAFAEKLSLKTTNAAAAAATSTSTTSATMNLVPLPKALKALTLGPGALDETKERNKKEDANGTTNQASLSALGGWLQNAMTTTTTSEDTNTSNDNSSTNTPSSRPPFPLPTSDAQNRIAELLLTRNYPAVVCEGPPGTGKTHTIANIVCAYLCQGKRVLVTSKGAPALSVLRDRLPECVQELCVDVSKSESSGMRQLQQTVERLANKVAWVNTERELGKSKMFKENIEELEAELRTIDSRLGSNAEEKRGLVQTQQGQDLFESAIELIESAPWLMKTISSWDAKKVLALHDTMKSLVIAPEDPMALVNGFESPPSDALISLVACNAGSPLSYLKNASKEVFAKVPLLGGRMAEHCSAVHEQVDAIRINGAQPSTTDKKDWHLVLERLKREKAICSFCQETLEPLFSREGWPRDILIEWVDDKQRIRESIIPVLDKASKMKQIADDLDLSSTLEEAIEIEKLDKRRAGLSSRIQAVAEDLVAARVVAELSKNFSAEAQSALVKFAQVSGKAKFGKSSQASKMTQRQRRKRLEYLDAFEKCVRYIPCWILTSSQISDYLPSECLFDLVVIDEASQSDVTVLPGMLRGRQWLIVGDGKQVSPTESFVAEEQIEMLKAAMPESPFEASMLPGHSFFDLCAQAFPMGRVILREHFRCAPEIISYSNLEFYNGNLVPLRLPTSKERLKPSLIDVRIPNGRKTGKINEEECDEIVNQIGRYVDGCPLLQKRSIGVISLVGDEQSRLIRGRLLDRIGPHKYKLHNILVGEPPSFQGAERDIVFLSMVCSPGSVVTQSQLMHAQRVNVALSRARDRMVLVRSIDTNHIPNEQDVKFSVLDFFERARYAEEMAGNRNLAAEDEREETGGDRQPSVSSFRARAERLLVKLLEEEGFATRSMGVVWDNAICVEDAGGTEDSSGRRAAICVEATGESQEDWKAILEQQKSIERVGWKCMRVDAVSFLANYIDVLGTIKKFLAAVMVFPREMATIEEQPLVGMDDEEEEVQNQGGDENAAIEIDQDPAGQQQNPDELVVISSDEEKDDEEMEDGDLKPAAIPSPTTTTRVKQEEPLEEIMNGLGNGETAADYGNVADLGFLGAGSSKYDSDEGDDDDDDDEDDFVAPRIVVSRPVPARSRKKQRTQHTVLEVDLGDDEDDEENDQAPFAARVPPVATGRKRRSRSSSAPKRGASTITGPQPMEDVDLEEKQRAVQESSKRTFPGDDLSVTTSSSSSGNASPSRSSKSSKRRKARLDKHSRDPKWFHRRADQQDDISHAEYIDEVQPEALPAQQQQSMNVDDDDDGDNNNDQDDQEKFEQELQQNHYDSDDDSYRDEAADV